MPERDPSTSTFDRLVVGFYAIEVSKYWLWFWLVFAGITLLPVIPGSLMTPGPQILGAIYAYSFRYWPFVLVVHVAFSSFIGGSVPVIAWWVQAKRPRHEFEAPTSPDRASLLPVFLRLVLWSAMLAFRKTESAGGVIAMAISMCCIEAGRVLYSASQRYVVSRTANVL